MFGLGTIVNTAAILAGGLLGLACKGILRERFQKIVTVAMGLTIIAMSLSDVVAKMLTFADGEFSARGTYTILFSLVPGAVVGELLNIDRNLERFGTFLKQKTGSAKDAAFVDAFVTASLTVCIGAMAVMGAIQDAVAHEHSILFIKAVMDGIIILIMTASMGKGCIFSAIPVFVFQGTVTVLATWIAPVLSERGMANLSMVGSVLVLCVGVNILCDGRYRIKVANLLPSIVFAAAAAYIPFLD